MSFVDSAIEKAGNYIDETIFGKKSTLTATTKSPTLDDFLKDFSTENAKPTIAGTSLENFLTKFSPPEGTLVAELDPLTTFDVTIEFHPNSELDSDCTLDTFIKDLLEDNMLINKDNNVGSGNSAGSSKNPSELQLGYYVQAITVPQMKVAEGTKTDTPLGTFNLHGVSVGPDNNQLQLTMLNTKLQIFERIFYPWMREITLPYWSYDSQPYTTATITIDFTQHCDIKYVFYGCRPTQIATLLPSQEQTGEMTRDVTFTFDFMFINSTFDVEEDPSEKWVSTGKKIGGINTDANAAWIANGKIGNPKNSNMNTLQKIVSAGEQALDAGKSLTLTGTLLMNTSKSLANRYK